MADSYLSIVPFALATMSRSSRSMLQAIEGLTADQVFWQPTADCNSIGWLIWHLNRRKDYYSSKLVGEEQTWVAGGWSERFGMNSVETGTGHSLAEVAALRPSMELLLGYAEAANQAAIDRLGRVTEASMTEEVDLDAGRGMKPRHNVWNPMLSDCLQHLGQVAYIRGMVTGKGWFDV